MQPQTIESRVDRLEQRVTILEQLPARVDALTLQVSQLREEMRSEFSAVRSEIRTGDEAVIRTLRQDIRAAADEIMGQARMLYEDARSQKALTKEGRPDRPKRG